MPEIECLEPVAQSAYFSSTATMGLGWSAEKSIEMNEETKPKPKLKLIRIETSGQKRDGSDPKNRHTIVVEADGIIVDVKTRTSTGSPHIPGDFKHDPRAKAVTDFAMSELLRVVQARVEEMLARDNQKISG